MKSVVKQQIKALEEKIEKYEDKLKRCNHAAMETELMIAIANATSELNSLNKFIKDYEGSKK